MSSPTDSSHRSIPFFSPPHPSPPRTRPEPAPPPSTPSIFAAFDTSSWADVRRAVAKDPSCLTALHPTLHLLPLDYAFSVIANTSAILAHCHRTGLPHTPRQALTTSATITQLFLTTFAPHLPPPATPVLHVALNTHLQTLAHALLSTWPFLAARPAGGQPPLHALAASVTAADAPASWRAAAPGLARALLARGADAAAADAHGRSALFELCSAAAADAAPPFGLVRRRGRGRGRRHTLRGVEAFVRLLIVNGARPCAVDENGVSAIRVAVARAVDYHLILRVADEVYRKLVETPRLKCRGRGGVVLFGGGKITELPEDVLRKIVALCSPRDAIAGIGATSTYFRSVATSGEQWRVSLSYPFTLDHAQKCVRQLDSYLG